MVNSREYCALVRTCTLRFLKFSTSPALLTVERLKLLTRFSRPFPDSHFVFQPDGASRAVPNRLRFEASFFVKNTACFIRKMKIRKTTGEFAVVPNSFSLKIPVNIATNRNHRRVAGYESIGYRSMKR